METNLFSSCSKLNQGLLFLEKNIRICFMILFLIFISCAQDDVIQKNELILEDITSEKKADITISPSGDISGITDATTLENALVALPPGGFLKLKGGTFYIDRTIVAPEGFNGIIKGKGMNKTEIIPVGDAITPFTSFNNNGVALYFPKPQGLISASKFAMSLPNGFVSDLNPLGNNDLFAFISVELGMDDTDTNFNMLKLTGSAVTTANPLSSFLVYQPISGIQVIGNQDGLFNVPRTLSSGGTHKVTKSKISKMGIEGVAHNYLKNAIIRISKNSFYDIKQNITRVIVGSNVKVFNNSIDAATLGSLVVTQEGFLINGNTSSVEIKGNIINTMGLTAIEIGGVMEADKADFDLLIKDNHLMNSGPDPSPFNFPIQTVIFIDKGHENAIVKANTLYGNANYGIRQNSDGGKFKNNDFSNFNANLFDYELIGNDNLLINIGNATVDDQGTGNKIKINDDD